MPRLNIAHASLREKAYQRLKELIVNETFSPGARINVERLTRDFGVSRTPIWEAVQKLIQEGLLENIPRRGVFVLNLSPERVEEIYSLWEVLEGFVARRAAERRDPAALSRIRKALDRQAKCLEKHDLAGYAQGVGDFHRSISAASGHRQAEGFLASVIGQSQALGVRSIYFPGRPAKDLEEHHAIFQAIERGDAARAEALARAHMRMVKEKVLESVAGGREEVGEIQRRRPSA
ncbi:MAG: GntR family transcriptional regulator [Nitrospinota bacterium]